MIRVAYLGPEGTNSHDAALAHFGESATFVPFPDIPATVGAVTARLVDQAIVPIENSTEGGVTVTLDLLIAADAPPIVGEMVLPVRHHLIARPGTRRQDIERVISIGQASAQCRAYLREQLPGAQVFPAVSTAAAVAACVHSDRLAAIGTETAARLYGMAVIDSNIEDNPDNATRFVVLGRERSPATGRDRTSLVFSLAADRPGGLLAALRPFADRAINLSRIESRPTKATLGSYWFFIDCEGHADDAPVAAAIAEVDAIAVQLRILGSYPRATG
jgi:prephenate dehydratase